MLPWRFSRTWFASQPTASKSGERYSAMPSSALSRSPASTLSAIGFSRWSVIINSFISNPPEISNAPNRHRRAPEQQERNTNITVHRKKRSVQLAQVPRFNKGMFVSKQRGNNRDACPCGPRQAEAERQPTEKRDNANVHHACDQQRVGNTEALRNGIQAGALVVFQVLARVEHVEAANPQRDRSAENQHARIEPTSDC